VSRGPDHRQHKRKGNLRPRLAEDAPTYRGLPARRRAASAPDPSGLRAVSTALVVDFLGGLGMFCDLAAIGKLDAPGIAPDASPTSNDGSGLISRAVACSGRRDRRWPRGLITVTQGKKSYFDERSTPPDVGQSGPPDLIEQGTPAQIDDLGSGHDGFSLAESVAQPGDWSPVLTTISKRSSPDALECSRTGGFAVHGPGRLGAVRETEQRSSRQRGR
jgi:hypothetical protein